MKLLDLFEYDPKIAQAFGKASSEIGQAASKLKGPLTVSDVQGRVEQEIDKLEKDIVRSPEAAFHLIFRARLKAIKKAEVEKLYGKEINIGKEFKFDLGLDLDVSQLTRNGKPNSGYIRRFLADFIKTLDKKIDSMSRDKTVKSVDRGRKVSI